MLNTDAAINPPKNGASRLGTLDEDGAEGLRAFRQHGGIAIAQSPGTAVNPEMPDAAIKTGVVDCVLPPEAIAARLEEIAKELKDSVHKEQQPCSTEDSTESIDDLSSQLQNA